MSATVAVWMQSRGRWRCAFCRSEIHTGLGMFRHLEVMHRIFPRLIETRIVEGGTQMVVPELTAKQVLLELRDTILTSGKQQPRWCCAMPECAFYTEFLTVAMFHIHEQHNVPMNAMENELNRVVVKRLNP